MISIEERNKLQDFIGYGRLDAPVWFLGMEEAGGGEDKLKIRAGFSRVEDLGSAQTRLGYGFHFEGRRKRQPQWWIMADVMIRLNGNSNPERDDRRLYQATRLGRIDGETLLLDLMYIPKPSLRDWNYPLSFPEFQSASDFYSAALSSRVRLLSDLIEDYRPPVIVAYGKTFWDYFRTLLPNAREYVDRDFNVRDSGHTIMILTHMLSTKEINGRTPALAEIIRARLVTS